MIIIMMMMIIIIIIIIITLKGKLPLDAELSRGDGGEVSGGTIRKHNSTRQREYACIMRA